jgi:hypothetical protein
MPTLPDMFAAATPLLILFSMRLLPTLAYVAFTPTISKISKLIVFAAVAPLLLATTTRFGSVVAYTAAGVLHYALSACALYLLIPWLRAERITRGALLALAVALFLFLPSLVLPGIAATAFLILGFEAVLSIYSYCVEQSKNSSVSRLRECLFFVLVDPTVVYVERSRRIAAPALNASGLLRLLWGVIGLVAGRVLFIPLGEIAPRNGSTTFTEMRGLVAVAPYVALQFLTTYIQHSSLASFRIGLMRQIGFLTPECYRYPLLASSPADFWRRWNIYLGAWIRRYIYLPLTLRIGRSLGTHAAPAWAKGLGVVLAFAIVGLIHSVFAYAETFGVNLAWIGWFTFHGCLLIAWAGVAALLRKVPARLRSSAVEFAAPSLFGRFVFLGALGSSIAYWST